MKPLLSLPYRFYRTIQFVTRKRRVEFFDEETNMISIMTWIIPVNFSLSLASENVCPASFVIIEDEACCLSLSQNCEPFICEWAWFGAISLQPNGPGQTRHAEIRSQKICIWTLCIIIRQGDTPQEREFMKEFTRSLHSPLSESDLFSIVLVPRSIWVNIMEPPLIKRSIRVYLSMTFSKPIAVTKLPAVEIDSVRPID
jgi:hypothetical protein